MGVTVLAFAIISSVIILTSLKKKNSDHQNLHLTISCESGPKLELNEIVNILNPNCSKLILKRFDEHQDTFQVIFLIEINTIQELEYIKSGLRAVNESVKITYSDNKGIF